MGEDATLPGLSLATLGAVCELSAGRCRTRRPCAGPCHSWKPWAATGSVRQSSDPWPRACCCGTVRAGMGMVASGVPEEQIADTLEGFGAGLSKGLPGRNGPLRDVAKGDILDRRSAALANEGLWMLHQFVARRPSEIDLVLVQGCGFPPRQGRPMHLSDHRRLMVWCV